METRTAGGFGSGKMGLRAAPFGIGEIGLKCFSHARYTTERMVQNPFSDSFKAKLVSSALRGFEAIGCFPCSIATRGVYRSALRQSSKYEDLAGQWGQ